MPDGIWNRFFVNCESRPDEGASRGRAERGSRPRSAVSRRAFLSTVVVGAPVSMLLACSPTPSASPTSAPAKTGPTTAPSKPAEAAPAKPAPQGAKRVTLAITTDVPNWSTYAQSLGATYCLWQNIYQGLVTQVFDEQNRGSAAPLLAERWETPDLKTWTFFLRRGVTFSDGTPLTAEDMVHSWNRLMNDSDSLQISALKPFISSMEATDPHTFRVDLKAPKVDFMDNLHNFVFTSKAHFDKLGKEAADKAPLGTGPYLFKEWVPGQRFVVTRNPRYWGTQPAADEVITRYMPDAIARVSALNSGEIDIADSIPPHLVGQIGSRAKALSVDGQRHMFLVMRPDNPPLDNKLVRQAIYHAIDRSLIVERVQDGYATELKGPIASFIPGFDAALPNYYPYDPAKAKALLTEAGHPNGFSIDFTVPAGQWVKDKETGEAIAAMLKEVGITANVKTPELPTYHSGYNEGKWGFYIVGRGSVLDPSGYLTQYFRTGSSRRVGYSNPELDKLLDADAGMTDAAARTASLSRIQRMIMEDAPAVFLYTYKNIYGVANTVDWRPIPNEYIHGFNVGLKA